MDEIVRQLSNGVYSNVFLCKTEDGELFVTKEISGQNMYKQLMSKRVEPSVRDVCDPQPNPRYKKKIEAVIRNEIYILRELKHPNIVNFRGYWNIEDTFYLQFEFCERGDLFRTLKKDTHFKRNIYNGFTNDFLYKYLIDIGSALLHLNELKIVHRDIKLENIILSHDTQMGVLLPVFKLSDFGFSYKLDTTDATSNVRKTCGTPFYMAPEVIHATVMKTGCVISHAADVWSFGTCLYELVFNRILFGDVQNVTELSEYFGLEQIQDVIYRKISDKEVINAHIHDILKMTLQVQFERRCTIPELYKNINSYDMHLLQHHQQQRTSTSMNNDTLKQKSPDSTNVTQESSDSWEMVTKPAGLDVDKRFFEWMFGTK